MRGQQNIKILRGSTFLILEVQDFDFFSWSPVLTQLYRLCVTGFDESGRDLVLTSLPNSPATSQIILSSVKLNITESEWFRTFWNKTSYLTFSQFCASKKCRCLLQIKYNAFLYFLIFYIFVTGILTLWGRGF